MENMEQKDLSVSRVLNRAIELFKDNWTGLLIITFVLAFINGICQIPSNIAQQLMRGAEDDEAILGIGIVLILIGIVLGILAGAAQSFLTCGYYRILKAAVLGEEYDSMELVKSSSNGWLKLWGATILVGFAGMIAFFMFILPFFYLCVKLLFVPMLVANHPEASISDSFKRSWKMTDGHFGELLLLGVVDFFINLFGLLLCCIGVFPAGILTNLMLAEVYDTLGGHELMESEGYNQQEETIAYE